MKENERKKFAQAVQQLRDNRSTRDFGELIGVSHTIIRQWENPQSYIAPDTKNIEKIALLRGESLQEFLRLLSNDAPLPDSFERLLKQIEHQASVLSVNQIAKILRVLTDSLELK